MRVHARVASNTSTPTNVLETLSKHEYWKIRNSVAGNRNTPLRVLEKLSKEKNWNVRETAIRTLEKL